MKIFEPGIPGPRTGWATVPADELLAPLKQVSARHSAVAGPTCAAAPVLRRQRCCDDVRSGRPQRLQRLPQQPLRQRRRRTARLQRRPLRAIAGLARSKSGGRLLCEACRRCCRGRATRGMALGGQGSWRARGGRAPRAALHCARLRRFRLPAGCHQGRSRRRRPAFATCGGCRAGCSAGLPSLRALVAGQRGCVRRPCWGILDVPARCGRRRWRESVGRCGCQRAQERVSRPFAAAPAEG